MLSRLWHHLPFAGRLLVTASIALLTAGLVMVGVAARQEARDSQSDLQQTLDQELVTLPNALAEVVAIGDFSTLQQTLDYYVARPLIVDAKFVDVKGVVLRSEESQRSSRTPHWFLDLFGFHQLEGTTPVLVGGREYGRLSLTLSPRMFADRVWTRLLQHMAILLLAVVIDFIGIWLVLRFGLRPLRRLEQATESIAGGEFDIRLDEVGSPEMRHLIRGFNRMAAGLKQGAEELRSSEERLQLAINGVNDGIWDWNLVSDEVYFSPKWKNMIGYSATELGNTIETFRALMHPDDADPVFEKLERVLADPHSDSYLTEFRLHTKEGGWRWILGRGTILRDEHGVAYRMAGSHTDITQRKRYEEALAAERMRLDAILRGTNAGSWEWNLQTGEAVFNERWAEIIGYRLIDLAPTSLETWKRFTHPDDLERAQEALERHLRGESDFYDCELRMRHRDGHWVWVLDRGRLVGRTERGQPRLMSGIHLDITERKQLEEQIRHQALYDTLTNLPNRRLLNDRLAQALVGCKRTGCHAALLFLDLDNFKPLNDQYGHKVGDLLLVEAARRLSGNLRESDTVARFGGDEFVVLVGRLCSEAGASRADVELIAQKLLARLSEPYRLEVHSAERTSQITHTCTVSIGIALFTGDDGEADDILRWADLAMYQAKAAGRNTLRFYSP